MNTVDFIVIGVVAVSALIAFLRGFVREMLTIGSWLGAGLVTLYAFPVLQPKFQQWISSSKLAADIVGGVGLFLGTLIVFSVVSHFIAKLVRGSALTAVDRSLGLLFGLLRGAVLVSLAYMVGVWLTPEIFDGARTAPMMARGAAILRSLAPKELTDGMSADLGAHAAGPVGEQKQDETAAPAYKTRDRQALQRLIDAASGH